MVSILKVVLQQAWFSHEKSRQYSSVYHYSSGIKEGILFNLSIPWDWDTFLWPQCYTSQKYMTGRMICRCWKICAKTNVKWFWTPEHREKLGRKSGPGWIFKKKLLMVCLFVWPYHVLRSHDCICLYLLFHFVDSALFLLNFFLLICTCISWNRFKVRQGIMFLNILLSLDNTIWSTTYNNLKMRSKNENEDRILQ